MLVLCRMRQGKVEEELSPGPAVCSSAGSPQRHLSVCSWNEKRPAEMELNKPSLQTNCMKKQSFVTSSQAKCAPLCLSFA